MHAPLSQEQQKCQFHRLFAKNHGLAPRQNIMKRDCWLP